MICHWNACSYFLAIALYKRHSPPEYLPFWMFSGACWPLLSTLARKLGECFVMLWRQLRWDKIIGADITSYFLYSPYSVGGSCLHPLPFLTLTDPYPNCRIKQLLVSVGLVQMRLTCWSNIAQLCWVSWLILKEVGSSNLDSGFFKFFHRGQRQTLLQGVSETKFRKSSTLSQSELTLIPVWHGIQKIIAWPDKK
jgi:hypothetical protein